MTHSDTLALLTDALTLTERWGAPLAGHDFKVTSDGLSIAFDSDPDVGGWSGIADASTADLGSLLTVLLRTGAVEHLQQTLRTAVTILTETGAEDDPAVRLGTNTAYEVLTIAKSLAPEDDRHQQMVERNAAESSLLFERYLSDDQPALPDIDGNFAREDRDSLRESLADRFGQPTR